MATLIITNSEDISWKRKVSDELAEPTGEKTFGK
jgi:hypothetical protein